MALFRVPLLLLAALLGAVDAQILLLRGGPAGASPDPARSRSFSDFFSRSDGPRRGLFSFPSLFSSGASSSSYVSKTTWERGSDGEMHKETHEMRTKIITDGANEKRSTAEVICEDGDCQKKMLRGSTAWIRGPDGNMHQKVHRETSKTVQQDDLTSKRMTELDCVDGLCHKQTMIMSGPGLPPASRLQRLFNHFMGPRVFVQPKGVVGVPAPVMVMSGAQMPVQVSVIKAVPLGAAAAPPPSAGTDFLAADLLFPCLVIACALPAVLSLFSRRSEAREIPLGEPLFPHAQGASADLASTIRSPEEVKAAVEQPHKAAEAAQAAAQDYLPKLYKQASTLADAQIARAYVLRMYARYAACS